LLAATAPRQEAINQVYNIALGKKTTLNDLFRLLQTALRATDASMPDQKPLYRDFRPGDVRHSLADIGKARHLLGYGPTHSIKVGLEQAMGWYRRNIA
jgi:UDP-N-acetylglucosamine/UDP-N-acetylgalactosamine 4-epimerase